MTLSPHNEAPTAPRPPRPWASVGRSAASRALILPASAILGIVSTRLIIDHFGTAAYAQYGLLVGIGSLIPFTDLGMSAALMNAVAASDDPAHDPHVRRVLTTAIRVLLGSAVVILLVTIVITASGSWQRLLGDGVLPRSGPTAAALCAAMIAISMPAGIGQRLWTGLGRNHIPTALLGLQPPVVLVCLLGVISVHTRTGAYLPVIPYVVAFAIAVGSTYFAGKQMWPVFAGAIRDVPRLRSVRGGGVFDVAWPMLIQLIALPIAMQTDRLILSHVSNLQNLAEYNLAAQMYLPVYYVVSAAGLALWPIFVRARVSGARTSVSPTRMSAAFGAAAGAVCVLISLAAPWLAGRASAGHIDISLGLMLSFSALMVFHAMKFPLGMFMTDAPGLRFQAVAIVFVLLPVNLALSWYLAVHIGAPGPVIGSAVGVFLSQVVANWFYVRRELPKLSPA